MAAQDSLEIDVFHNGTHRYSKKSIQGLASLKMSGEWVLHHKKTMCSIMEHIKNL